METLNNYFDKVCELDIILNIERSHYIIQEMMQNGQILETNRETIMQSIREFDQRAEDAI